MTSSRKTFFFFFFFFFHLIKSRFKVGLEINKHFFIVITHNNTIFAERKNQHFLHKNQEIKNIKK